MRTFVAGMIGLALLMTVSSAQAQMQPGTPPQSPESHHPARQGTSGEPPRLPMMGQGMMGDTVCPMMGLRMMGMEPGMMGGMMAASDPKAMARMLKLRGDMMKAVGEVMLKHAHALEQEK